MLLKQQHSRNHSSESDTSGRLFEFWCVTDVFEVTFFGSPLYGKMEALLEIEYGNRVARS